MPIEPSEKEIETAILEWLNLQPNCKAWKNNSVGVFDPYKKVFRKSHSKFSQKGTSDIIGIFCGLMICIEVKSRKGRLSPEQSLFLEAMSNLGACAFVARSLDDVIQVFDQITGVAINAHRDSLTS